MSDERVRQIVQQAVAQNFDQWALQHPTLSAVIDRVSLTEQTVESLRQSPQYLQALADYNRDLGELNLLNQLLQLVGPILYRILGV